MPTKKKAPTWSQCKKLVRAAAHISVQRGKDETASCSICGETHDLSQPFKKSGIFGDPVASKRSALLAFTKHHFYKHKINESFDLDQSSAVQGELI